MTRFFAKVFEDLNAKIGDDLFTVTGKKIKPRDKRVQLILTDSFSTLSTSNLQSLNKMNPQLISEFVALYPAQSQRELAEIVKRHNDVQIYIHSFETQDQKNIDRMSRRLVYVTEELGTFISSLYLRSLGYIVGCRHTYGKEGDKPGVDDVVAWKSPVLGELRELEFIDAGCTMTELAYLRWLGREHHHCKSSVGKVDKELILVEVKRSRKLGLSKGMDQLFRARKEEQASGLYICFPLSDEDNISVVNAEIHNKCRFLDEPNIGSILFDDQKLKIQPSDDFHPAKLHAEIDRLEGELMTILLSNFNLGEILKLADDLGISTQDRRFEDVATKLLAEIAKEATEEATRKQILKRLNEVVP